jgi:hypothetical protein
MLWVLYYPVCAAIRKYDRQGDHIQQEWVCRPPFAVFLASLAVRLIMVRDLVTPPWIDPVHHATITLISETGPTAIIHLIDLG